jgi:hypothetical protein
VDLYIHSLISKLRDGNLNSAKTITTSEIHYSLPSNYLRLYRMNRAIGLVLDFIHRLVGGRQKIPQRFGDWICLRPQVDGAGQTYSVGPVRKS